MTRYYAEEPCEHGLNWGPHPEPDSECPGGSRRELTDVRTVEWCEIHHISANQTVTLVKHGEKVCYMAAYLGDSIHDEFGKPALSNCRIVFRSIIPLPPEADE